MKKIILFFAIVIFSASLFSQKKNVLFTINKEPVYVEEFKRVYEKNLNLIQDEDSRNIDNYLDLYINYKLKLKQAYSLGLDSSRSYKRELNTYKNQLSAPYLQDNSLIDKLVEEAYFRTKNEIKVKHILVRFPKGMEENDTLEYFKKILSYRNRIINGEPFEKVAFEVSEDPSVKKNKGNLGYFSAFQMVYPFEDAAYKTKIGEVSKPFKTRFGYHILKVDAMRSSRGEFEVAHIVANDRSIVGKVRMDSVYKKLQMGENFEALAKQYSSDKGSAVNGGKLPKFGTGKMVDGFENIVHSLQKIGDYSKPFKTKFGWHIVKLLKNYPVQPLEKVKKKLRTKVKSSSRAKLSRQAVVNRLKAAYKIQLNDEAFKQFKSGRRDFSKDSLQAVLITINNKKITQESFAIYIGHRRHLPIDILKESFINQEIITYFKENLEYTEPKYKNTIQEYRDGLLLFDLMEKKIWNKSVKDTLGLRNFFSKQTKFKEQKLSEIKGEVMSDYQTYLEENWIEELRRNIKIDINKKALRRFKKQYNQ